MNFIQLLFIIIEFWFIHIASDGIDNKEEKGENQNC